MGLDLSSIIRRGGDGTAADINEARKEEELNIGWYMKAPGFLIPSDYSEQSSSSPSLSPSSSSSIHSHRSPASSNAHTISTHSSLNSLPSLTLTFTAPFSHYGLPSHHHEYHSECECIATVLLDAHVSALASSGDSLYGGSCSSNTMHVWSKNELHKGKIAHDACERVKLGYGDGAVRALAAVGVDRVVSAHDHDNKIRAWKVSSLTQNATPHVAPVNYHCFKLLSIMPTLKDYLRTFLLANNYVQVRRHHKRLWIEHVDAISALAVSKDGQLLYSASWDRSIKVWRLSDFKCMGSVQKAHDDAINCLVLSHDGNFVYTGSADAKIKVWAVHIQAARRVQAQRYDGHDGRREKSKSIQLAHSAASVLEGHKSAVNALALSPDGRVLYSGAGDKAIIVWEKEETTVEHMVRAGVLRGHRNAILCLATIEAQRQEGDGQVHMLCSGSADKTIRIWKAVRSKSCMQDTIRNRMQLYEYSSVGVLEGHMGPVRCLNVGLSHDNVDDDPPHHVHYLYSASLDRTLKVWRLPMQ